jgi:hypothetical protein
MRKKKLTVRSLQDFHEACRQRVAQEHDENAESSNGMDATPLKKVG